MEVIALDIGFGYTKATDGRRHVVFKSVYGEAVDTQFRESLLDDAGEDAHLHIEIGGKGYYVGELAERHSELRNFTLDPSQFVAEFTRVLALAPLATLVARQDAVKLVAGLPIGHYRKHKDDLAKILRGQHAVGRIDARGERSETVIRIAEVRVVPQPFGSVFNLMLGDSGQVRDEGLAREKVGVIDIGFRTTDFTVADRTRYLERGSRTTDAGISRAYQTIAAKVSETSGVAVELYRLYDAVDRGWIKIHGKRYDLKGLRDRTFAQLATSIATDANRLWAADWDMDRIVLTGGGGPVLAPFLQPQLKGEVVPVDSAQDNRLNNVNGYLKYGRRLWTRGAAAAAPADSAESPESGVSAAG